MEVCRQAAPSYAFDWRQPVWLKRIESAAHSERHRAPPQDVCEVTSIQDCVRVRCSANDISVTLLRAEMVPHHVYNGQGGAVGGVPAFGCGRGHLRRVCLTLVCAIRQRGGSTVLEGVF